jgi:hypothetical protein
VNTNKQNFLDWLQKTIVDLCNTPPPLSSQEDLAKSWFLLTTGLPPNLAAAGWVDAKLSVDPQLPVALVPPWPPASPPAPGPTNGQLYCSAIQTIIDLFLARGGYTADEQLVVNWFTGFPPMGKPGSGAVPPPNVPLPVRDWVRKNAPPGSGGVIIGGGTLELQFIKDGDGVLFIANKLVDFKPIGLKHDLAQLIVALDAAERIMGSFGKTLVKHIKETILDLVTATMEEPSQVPTIEVLARSKKPLATS